MKISRLTRRIRRSRILLLILALTGGMLTRSVVASAQTTKSQWGQKIAAVRIATDLKPGSKIGLSDLVPVLVPKLLSSIFLVKSPDEIIGKRTQIQLFKGELAIKSRFHRSGSALAAMIGPNQLAVTLTIEKASREGIAINDRVDVVSLSSAGARENFSNLEVLEVNDSSMTVAVRADWAAALALAAQGHLGVALRGIK